MTPFLLFSLLTILIVTAWEDFKDRKIHLALLILGIFNSYLLRYIENGSTVLIDRLLINGGFYIIQLLGIELYLFIKFQKLINPFMQFYGFGDFLLTIALLPLLNPLSFVQWYLTSLILSGLTHLLLIKFFRNQNHRKIPLAGCQSLSFAVVIASDLAVYI